MRVDLLDAPLRVPARARRLVKDRQPPGELRQPLTGVTREGKLFIACEKGQVDAARLLLDKGAEAVVALLAEHRK